jgi:glycosyltransferase involved in cell wall biosynthesis
VQERIKKTYKKDSVVIYPPVKTDKFRLNLKKDDFYLTACRLVPYKKTKLIVEAFNEMSDKKLVVIGSGEEFLSIKSIAKENIVLLGFKEEKELIKYMQEAKAFLYAAIEDFGIVPIEALSCGTPVIALNQGGTAETIRDGISGVHFQNQTKEDIVDAVRRFEKIDFSYETVSDEAKKYNENRFKKEFEDFVNLKLINK